MFAHVQIVWSTSGGFMFWFVRCKLSQKLQSISLHVDAIHTLSHTDEHEEIVNNRLLNSCCPVLEQADKCTSRFGETIVLYAGVDLVTFKGLHLYHTLYYCFVSLCS